MIRLVQILVALLLCQAISAPVSAQKDPLPSWREGSTKQAIIAFVGEVTAEGGPKFVPAYDRVAVFDQDGTTWVEHPLYAQGLFTIDRVVELAPAFPDWQSTEPFSLLLKGGLAAASHLTENDWEAIVAATHAEMSNEAFEDIVAAWLPRSRNPAFDVPVTDLVYEPMREVIRHLQANGFKTYIVTGGGQEFVRVFSRVSYGIPPSQVIGSTIATKLEFADGKPLLMRQPKVFFVDDGAGKVIGINLFIGQRPLIAFGNSDGDKEMLAWITAGPRGGSGFLVLHDDPVREFAYGPANGLPDTRVGTFSQALMDAAGKNGWHVISMKEDWKTIFRAGVQRRK